MVEAGCVWGGGIVRKALCLKYSFKMLIEPTIIFSVCSFLLQKAQMIWLHYIQLHICNKLLPFALAQ